MAPIFLNSWIGVVAVGETLTISALPKDAAYWFDQDASSSVSDWYSDGYSALGDAVLLTCITQRFSQTSGWYPLNTLNLSGEGDWDYAYKTALAGEHRILFRWTWSGGETWTVYRWFDVYDYSGGGETGSGRIISMHTLEHPGVTHLVWQTANGDLIARQGPK